MNGEDDEIAERPTDAWHRELNDGRLEIMCRTPGYRMRVSAPAEQAWQAVELFEEWTGLSISSERRPRRRSAPPPGQLALDVPTSELMRERND